MDNNNSSTDLLQEAKEYFENKVSNEVSQPISERLKNPLFFSFLIAFIIVNWDVILYFIFSDDIIEYKINHFYLHYASFRNQLIKPLFAAILYTISYPFIINWIYIISFKAKSITLDPSNDFKLLEAQKARDLQKAISEGTDIALQNVRTSELEKQLKLKDIKLAENQSLLEKTILKLQEAKDQSMEKDLKIEEIKSENLDILKNARREFGDDMNNFNTQFIKIFNNLYTEDQFSADLFQDSFSFKKKIDNKMLDGFKNFMKDRMKYFGLFTTEIKTLNISNSEKQFTIYFHYPNFKVNEDTKISIKKMFEELEI